MRRTADGHPDVYALTPVPWALACDFPPQLTSPVRWAVDYFRGVLGDDVVGPEQDCVEAGSSRQAVTFVVDPETSFGEVWGLAPRNEKNGAELDRYVIFIKMWVDAGSDVLREHIARHEFGHVLGLEHTSETGCLMFPWQTHELSRPVDLCERELDLLRRFYR